MLSVTRSIHLAIGNEPFDFLALYSLGKYNWNKCTLDVASLSYSVGPLRNV